MQLIIELLNLLNFFKKDLIFVYIYNEIYEIKVQI